MTRKYAESLCAISSIIGFIGAFLPWATVTSTFGSITYFGINGDGLITIILSIIALGLLYRSIKSTKKKFSYIGIVVTGFLILIVSIPNFISVGFSGTSLFGAVAGIGLYLTIIGGIGLIISGILYARTQ
jgi:hypothetical protein